MIPYTDMIIIICMIPYFEFVITAVICSTHSDFVASKLYVRCSRYVRRVPNYWGFLVCKKACVGFVTLVEPKMKPNQTASKLPPAMTSAETPVGSSGGASCGLPSAEGCLVNSMTALFFFSVLIVENDEICIIFEQLVHALYICMLMCWYDIAPLARCCDNTHVYIIIHAYHIHI